jgi:sigma-54 dependent transcriptional regulator, acetoin dehydrogenase operon transcriptional activator AcoR
MAEQHPIRIVFICSRNACRSQMAEGFARARREPGVDVYSAGVEATAVHPMARRVMAEAGIDISAQASKTFDTLPVKRFDVVITLCSEAAEACPFFPGLPAAVDWNLPNPDAVRGDETVVLKTFRESRDAIRRLVDDLFDRGYLLALARAGARQDAVLDTISDGLLAHDRSRRIFLFNRAAERITGYAAEDVLNRDCREVFPGGFCGGKCLFDPEPPAAMHVYVENEEIDIAARDGERRRVTRTVHPLPDDGREHAAVVVSFRDITRESALSRRVGEAQQLDGMIGRDPKMLDLFDLIREVADSSVPVLIQGESGTGKELVAAAIHNQSARANRLFVPVNCGALPESLLESELFGHVKGAFTGAIRDKKGRFELADGGTIFLDEIGDISPAMQVKLLRVLQEGHFERVGSETTLQVDVRVVSATNKDIAREIAEGRFREDLYYRLSVLPIFLPPLRERRNDIPLLVDHILTEALKNAEREPPKIAPDTLDLMMEYDWPGNVRELQNWIQFALVKCHGDAIRPEHLPTFRLGDKAPPTPRRRRRKLDAHSVEDALRRTGGNRLEAARLLGVSRATLYRYIGASKR